MNFFELISEWFGQPISAELVFANIFGCIFGILLMKKYWENKKAALIIVIITIFVIILSAIGINSYEFLTGILSVIVGGISIMALIGMIIYIVISKIINILRKVH